MRKFIALAVVVTTSFSIGVASAQDSSKTKVKDAKSRKIKVEKKTDRTPTRPRVDTSRPNTSAANVGAALNADLTGQCYRFTEYGRSEDHHKGKCAGTRTNKLNKRVDCTPYTLNNGTTHKVACQVHGVSGNRHYEIRDRSGVVLADVADMACGCGPNLSAMTCSGGLCSVSR